MNVKKRGLVEERVMFLRLMWRDAGPKNTENTSIFALKSLK